MTYKECVKKKDPGRINSDYDGGVEGCPYSYGLELESDCIKNCCNGCDYCWNREMPSSMMNLISENESKEPKENLFTESDLKPGMVVEFANGERKLFLNGMFIGYEIPLTIEDYDDRLENNMERSLDIMRVYTVKNYNLGIIFNDENLTPIWCRDKLILGVKEAELKLKEFIGGNVEIIF